MYSVFSNSGFWLAVWGGQIELRTFRLREQYASKVDALSLIERAHEQGFKKDQFSIYNIEKV